MTRQHGTLASGHKGRISIRELKHALHEMEEFGLDECDCEIGEWSDTKLVQLTLVDDKGEWLT